jgi:glycosyltransferase involved in cell wall biosynthesis
LEVICIDGASTDHTVEIVRQYPGLVSQLVSEPDQGQADALNKGFSLASGDVYCWLCADDELAEGAIRAAVEFLVDHPEIDVVTGGCRRAFEGGSSHETMPEEGFADKLLLKNTIEQPSTYWRAGIHRQAGELSLRLKYAFDWEYWCRLKRAGANFASISQVLSVYYFSATNLTSTGGRKIAREMFSVVREYGPYGGRIAWIYAILYAVFDLRGFYDKDVKHGRIARWVFHSTLRVLYALFDQESVNAYNWNFASRQERGLGW